MLVRLPSQTSGRGRYRSQRSFETFVSGQPHGRSATIAATHVSFACPRCAIPRDKRDGPYYVCMDCSWAWTVSVTGRVYVERAWPPSPEDKLREAGFTELDIERLRRTRDATRAGFFSDA